jgi:hypothetical protein
VNPRSSLPRGSGRIKPVPIIRVKAISRRSDEKIRAELL